MAHLCRNCRAAQETKCDGCGNPMIDRRYLSSAEWGAQYGAMLAVGTDAANSRGDLARAAVREPPELAPARIDAQATKAAFEKGAGPHHRREARAHAAVARGP